MKKIDGAFLSGLRVRIKELAQEAKYIRHEENKIKSRQKIKPVSWYDCGPKDFKSEEYRSLESHRKFWVRPAARESQLAYAFLRGIPYKQVEQSRKPEKEWHFQYKVVPQIIRLVNKFSYVGWQKDPRKYDEEVKKWLTSE